jgi:hypothetical protein
MAEAAQQDMDALTRAIDDIARNFTIIAQEIAQFLIAPTVPEANQILHLLAAVQARLARLDAIVNANDIIAENNRNAIIETINGHIATVLARTTNAIATLTSL